MCARAKKKKKKKNVISRWIKGNAIHDRNWIISQMNWKSFPSFSQSVVLKIDHLLLVKFGDMDNNRYTKERWNEKKSRNEICAPLIKIINDDDQFGTLQITVVSLDFDRLAYTDTHGRDVTENEKKLIHYKPCNRSKSLSDDNRSYHQNHLTFEYPLYIRIKEKK